jgi:hypothetical protein
MIFGTCNTQPLAHHLRFLETSKYFSLEYFLKNIHVHSLHFICADFALTFSWDWNLSDFKVSRPFFFQWLIITSWHSCSSLYIFHTKNTLSLEHSLHFLNALLVDPPPWILIFYTLLSVGILLALTLKVFSNYDVHSFHYMFPSELKTCSSVPT